jgi:hypothetical protein
VTFGAEDAGVGSTAAIVLFESARKESLAGTPAGILVTPGGRLIDTVELAGIGGAVGMIGAVPLAAMAAEGTVPLAAIPDGIAETVPFVEAFVGRLWSGPRERP